MDFLRTIFTLNRDIIYFGYGLVFFVLGLAIALQSRNYSRLDLARSLKWLAAFGFVHAFNEWGDLFIPIQSAYASLMTIDFLHRVHLLLLAVSYAFLFEFGVTLLKPLGLARWIHGIPTVLLAIWFFVVYFPLPVWLPDFHTWHNTSDALARYFLGFPGALLSAYALRKHTMQRIAPLNVPHIVKMLRFAGVMLAFYSVFGGLITPPVHFFPGNIFNNVNFEAAFAAPPPVFRSVIGLGLAIAIIRALEVFDVETARMIESIEQQQILSTERNRIARDLHDGAIQKVYTAGLLIESAHKQVKARNEALASRLMKAEVVLNDAISDLRHSLGELRSTPLLESFPSALRKLAEDPRYHSLVDVSLDLELPVGETLSPVRADHVLAVIHEALSNSVRHARAKEVKISAHKQGNSLLVEVVDDGTGLPKQIEAGYGLRNMRDRARLLGGELEVSSLNGKGTMVRLEIPWKDER
jgi:signal transduction histidine kinase